MLIVNPRGKDLAQAILLVSKKPPAEKPGGFLKLTGLLLL